MSPYALFLLPFICQSDSAAAFAKAKTVLESSVVKSASQDAAFTYKLTDHTATNFIFRETYQRLSEKDTLKTVVRVKFDQIEAILTRTDEDRAKPTKDCDPVVKIVFKSEPEFLDIEKQKWGKYAGEDRFEGVDIVCASHAQSDEIADALAELVKAHGFKIPVLKQFNRYESSMIKASDAKAAKELKAEEEQRKKAMKPLTNEVREMMKSLKDYVEIFCKGLDDEANTYEMSIPSITDEGFTVRKNLAFLSEGNQSDSVTIPWHLIKHLSFNLKPGNDRAFIRVHLLRGVKMYRKGSVFNDTQDVEVVELMSPSDKAIEQIAAWIGYIPFKRGLKVTVQDLARG